MSDRRPLRRGYWSDFAQVGFAWDLRAAAGIRTRYSRAMSDALGHAQAKRAREPPRGWVAARFVPMSGCGHWQQFGVPATCTRRYLDFFRDEEGPTT